MNICLNGDNLMWISLGGLASIILGMLLPISDIFLSWVSISFLPEATFGRALHGGWWYAILYLLLAVVAGISAFAQVQQQQFMKCITHFFNHNSFSCL